MNTTYVARHDELVRDFHINIEKATPEYSRVSMLVQDGVRNATGACHGGALFTLADVAFGTAANCESPTMVVTLNASIEYLRPALAGTLVAEARLTHAGKNLVRYDVHVMDSNGEVVAQMLITGARTRLTPPNRANLPLD